MKNKRFDLFSYAFGFIISLVPVSIHADTNPAQNVVSYANPKEELAAVNAKIAELKEQRRIFAIRAEYFGREADRIMTQDWLAYKRYINAQTAFQDQVGAIDDQLKTLEARQKELQKKVGS